MNPFKSIIHNEDAVKYVQLLCRYIFDLQQVADFGVSAQLTRTISRRKVPFFFYDTCQLLLYIDVMACTYIVILARYNILSGVFIKCRMLCINADFLS